MCSFHIPFTHKSYVENVAGDLNKREILKNETCEQSKYAYLSRPRISIIMSFQWNIY